MNHIFYVSINTKSDSFRIFQVPVIKETTKQYQIDYNKAVCLFSSNNKRLDKEWIVIGKRLPKDSVLVYKSVDNAIEYLATRLFAHVSELNKRLNSVNETGTKLQQFMEEQLL